MATQNYSKAAGLSPVKSLTGADWNSKGNLHVILAADVNQYSPGDLVSLTGVGDKLGLPGITLTAAGATAVGVIVAMGINPDGGPYINPNSLQNLGRPAGVQPQNYYALVIDDPYVIFEIQEGGVGANLTTASVGKNANILYAAPALPVGVLSATTLNGASAAVTSTLNLKIISLARRPDNAFNTVPPTGGSAQKWWCLINNHSYRAGMAGI